MTADLTTSWLGLELRNPLVASSSPLTGDLEALRRLEDAGIGAVVLPSLFEEQIEHESLEMQRLVEYGAGQFAEAFEGYFPELERYATTTDRYLELVAAAKEALEVPVVASLNGTTRGGWIRYAKRLEDAGADAVELNVFLVPTDPNASCVETERRYLDLVAAVAESVSVPVDVKLAPFFTNLAHTARALDEAGASGLTLFNRFYQPDIDLEELRVVPDLRLSHPDELRLPLRWTAILCGKVRADLAVTSGVWTAEDVIKALLVGANAVMMASALLRHGPGHVAQVLAGVSEWLDEHDYVSVSQLRGSMCFGAAPNPEAFVRANYMEMLVTYTAATD